MSTRGVNKAIILGNIGQDPIIREFATGKMVAISVATSETWIDKKTQDEKTDTQWHRIVFFGKLAEIAAQYLRKGAKVYIEGALKTRKYEKDGYEQTLTEIVANNMQMLSSREPSEPVSHEAIKNMADGNKATANVYANDGFDDDIPF